MFDRSNGDCRFDSSFRVDSFFCEVEDHFDISLQGSFQNISSLRGGIFNGFVDHRFAGTVPVAQWIARWTSKPEA